MRYVNKDSLELSQYVPPDYCEAVLFTGENADEIIAFIKPHVPECYFKIPWKLEIDKMFGEKRVCLVIGGTFINYTVAPENCYVICPCNPDIGWKFVEREHFEDQWELVTVMES